jgi:hypothetical protein
MEKMAKTMVEEIMDDFQDVFSKLNAIDRFLLLAAVSDLNVKTEDLCKAIMHILMKY